MNSIIQFDRQIFLAINHGTKCGFLDATMPWLTHLGLGHIQALLVLGVLAAVIWREKVPGVAGRLRGSVSPQRAWVVPLLLCLILSYSSDVVKAIAPRERPNWYYLNRHEAGQDLNIQVFTVPGVDPLRVRSFPSGHATSSFALAAAISVLGLGGRRWRWGRIGLWGLAAVIAFSRIYLASHWPLDVLSGAILGSLCGVFAVLLCRWWAGRDSHVHLDAPFADSVVTVAANVKEVL